MSNNLFYLSSFQGVDTITDFLGTQGIQILSTVLSDSEDRGARKNAMDALTKKGDLVRDWIFKVLDDPEQKWFLIRNALMLLGHVGKNEKDIEHARKLLHNEHSMVRDEALNVVAHYRKTAQLIRALGGINDIPNREEAEDAILEMARQSSEQKKGLIKRIKESSGPDQFAVLSAAISALGNIGTAKSEAFLEELAGSKSPQAEPAQKAANHIKLRNIEQLSSDAPQSTCLLPAQADFIFLA